jgi:thiazole synthase
MSESRSTPDAWRVGDVTLTSRFLLGTAGYPSPQTLGDAIAASRTQVVTVGLKRTLASGGDNGFVESIRRAVRSNDARLLPNTAGCRSAREAVQLAHMARELFDTPWIKLEVIRDDETLQPDVFGLVEAACVLAEDGFEVFPYTTEDLAVADRLVEAGCRVLMPWGAPIGSARGLNNLYGLRALRAHFPAVPLVVDAGLGVPSHASAAMELGYDAVLLNTAVAEAGDPVAMAKAFALAIEAGRMAFAARPLEPRDMAVPSTPVLGRAALGD